MELVTAPVEELRVRLRTAFEDVVDGSLHCGLTGGSTALVFLGALRAARVDWSKVSFYWGDERDVPYDDPESNFGVARRVLIAPLGARAPRVSPMPGGNGDLHEAAMAYDDLLAHELEGRALDLIILGVGEDGHVCSLFPGHQALLEEQARVVAVDDAPKPPPRRLSLSLPFVLNSRRLWIVAIGQRKRPVLQAAVSRSQNATPIDLILQRAKNVTVFTDQSVRL